MRSEKGEVSHLVYFSSGSNILIFSAAMWPNDNGPEKPIFLVAEQQRAHENLTFLQSEMYVWSYSSIQPTARYVWWLNCSTFFAKVLNIIHSRLTPCNGHFNYCTVLDIRRSLYHLSKQNFVINMAIEM